MTFADRSVYDAYNDYPSHLAFVRERWAPEVEAFMEHDTEALDVPRDRELRNA